MEDSDQFTIGKIRPNSGSASDAGPSFDSTQGDSKSNKLSNLIKLFAGIAIVVVFLNIVVNSPEETSLAEAVPNRDQLVREYGLQKGKQIEIQRDVVMKTETTGDTKQIRKELSALLELLKETENNQNVQNDPLYRACIRKLEYYKDR